MKSARTLSWAERAGGSNHDSSLDAGDRHDRLPTTTSSGDPRLHRPPALAPEASASPLSAMEEPGMGRLFFDGPRELGELSKAVFEERLRESRLFDQTVLV